MLDSAFRTFFSDSTSFDFPYWASPPQWGFLSFDVKTFSGKSLKGQNYIFLSSSDNSTAYISINNICLLKMT